MKKLLCILLALIMVMAMAVTGMAASITIEGGASGSEYAAYKLLDATNAGENFAYTLNEKYTAILQTITGKTGQADIIAYIAALDAEGIRVFADKVYASIKADAALTADYTAAQNSFADVAQGYYLIAETKTGNAGDTYSLVMLDTAGDEAITVKTKESTPTVVKKVLELNDSVAAEGTWGDSADHDLGDAVQYRITGTVSSLYADYLSYYYSFSDTMATGLTLNTDSIKVTIGDVDVTAQFKIEAAEHAFTATANLKELTGVTITGETEVIVTYTATLNEEAVIGGVGNPNEVILEYENDPYHQGDGDPTTPDAPETPGETPEDVNVVFTYEAVVNKTDKDSNPLAGAGFTLYKWDADAEAEDKWIAVGEEIKGDAVTTFTFSRLDAGKYKLVETTVPAGYNKAEDIEFEIAATTSLDETFTASVTALEVRDAAGTVISTGETASFAADMTKGQVSTNVINSSGVELPSTGGAGTTALYVGGGILVLAAVALLILKKRNNA